MSTDRQADEWTRELLGGQDPEAHPAIQRLARDAFRAYSREWRRWSAHSARWDWPFQELAHLRAHPHHHAFMYAGDQPWTVMLRHAVHLARDASRRELLRLAEE